MKTLRALYMIVVDILAIPVMALFVTIMVVTNVVHCVRHKYGVIELMRCNKAIAEGIELGMEQQVYWVKHGDKASEVYLQEKMGLD